MPSTRATYTSNVPAVPNILRGGSPLFKEHIFVTRPNLPDKRKFFAKLEKMLDNGWVTNFGPFHREFQRELQDLLNVKYVLPCNNATTGLFAVLRALGLKNDIITTPFTFAATVHAISMNGLNPVFCDIHPDTYTIDADKAEKLVTRRTSAILAVNVYGNACEADKLGRISKKHSIPVVYDSAHAFCSRYGRRFIGSFGKAEVFSFHATKFFSTMEGGAVATNDAELYRKLKLLINFGIQDEETVVSEGLNGKMAEMNAIAGLVSFGALRGNYKKLEALYRQYVSELAVIPGLKLQKTQARCSPVRQYLPLEVIPREFGLSRDELSIALKSDNVYPRKYFYPPANKYECYKKIRASLPVTELVSSRILCLPMYASLGSGDVHAITELIKSVQLNAVLIARKLRG